MSDTTLKIRAVRQRVRTALLLAAVIVLSGSDCDKTSDFFGPLALMGAVDGQVLVDGEPTAGVPVVLRANGQEVDRTVTDAAGTYLLLALGGDYTVSIEAPTGARCDEDSRSVTVQPEQTSTADFSCERAITIPEITGEWSFDFELTESTCPGDETGATATGDATLTSPGPGWILVTFPDSPEPIELDVQPDGSASGATAQRAPVPGLPGIYALESWIGRFFRSGAGIRSEFESNVGFFESETGGEPLCERILDVVGSRM